MPSSEQAELKQWLSALLALRAAHPAPHQGSGSSWWPRERLWRHQADGGEQVVYLLNVSTTPQSYAVPVGKLRSGSALVDLRQSGENLAIGGSSGRWTCRPSPAALPAGALREAGERAPDGALFHGGGLLDAARSSRREETEGSYGPVAPVFQPVVHLRRRLLKLASSSPPHQDGEGDDGEQQRLMQHVHAG